MLDQITFDQLPSAVATILDDLAELKEICNDIRGRGDSEAYLTIEELQAYHPDHPSRTTIHRWKRDGYLPFYRDPDEWAPSAPRKEPAKPATPEAIEALTQAVEASGIDITPNYSDWLAIAFALVAELGEGGRSVYHRLSRFNPTYDPAETDR